ncbi:MAG: HNH endonuclease [Salinibacterium sp.]|nr:MAG: HNH endonuclease [Salinibacterium sp.]
MLKKHEDVSWVDAARFWERVEKTDGCWLWKGKGRRGSSTGPQYGCFTFRGERRAETSNRAAWRVQKGPIPKGKCVLHKCDNSICVRGSHLFLGTRTENSADMVKKGRQAKGTDKPNAKLDEQRVRDFRRRHKNGESPTVLAKEAGMHIRSFWSVLRRETWAWVI